MNSKEINDRIELAVEKAISKQINDDKNTISKLRDEIKQLETDSGKTKLAVEKAKKNNNALNNLSLDSSLCKKVLSVKTVFWIKVRSTTSLIPSQTNMVSDLLCTT